MLLLRPEFLSAVSTYRPPFLVRTAARIAASRDNSLFEQHNVLRRDDKMAISPGHHECLVRFARAVETFSEAIWANIDRLDLFRARRDLLDRAGVAQWQSRSFPSLRRGFDSLHPLQRLKCPTRRQGDNRAPDHLKNYMLRPFGRGSLHPLQCLKNCPCAFLSRQKPQLRPRLTCRSWPSALHSQRAKTDWLQVLPQRCRHGRRSCSAQLIDFAGARFQIIIMRIDGQSKGSVRLRIFMSAIEFRLRRQRRNLRQRIPHLRRRSLKQPTATHGKKSCRRQRPPALPGNNR